MSRGLLAWCLLAATVFSVVKWVVAYATSTQIKPRTLWNDDEFWGAVSLGFVTGLVIFIVAILEAAP